MLYQAMSSAEAGDHLDIPYNPPAEDNDLFSEEWWSVREAVALALTPLGQWNDYGRGDYCVGETHCASRGISVELTSEKLIHPQFIWAVRDVLSNASCPYSVCVTDGAYSFVLFIEPDRILLHATNPTLPRRLGLMSKEYELGDGSGEPEHHTPAQLYGSMAGSITILGDIESPIYVEWDAER